MEAEGDLLNFPFEQSEHQRESALFGMWIFLATEVLFFGGMFTAYAMYRFSYWEAFQEAGSAPGVVSWFSQHGGFF